MKTAGDGFFFGLILGVFVCSTIAYSTAVREVLVQSGNTFRIDYAAYKCTKTDELKWEKQ